MLTSRSLRIDTKLNRKKKKKKDTTMRIILTYPHNINLLRQKIFQQNMFLFFQGCHHPLLSRERKHHERKIYNEWSFVLMSHERGITIRIIIFHDILDMNIKKHGAKIFPAAQFSLWTSVKMRASFPSRTRAKLKRSENWKWKTREFASGWKFDMIRPRGESMGEEAWGRRNFARSVGEGKAL